MVNVTVASLRRGRLTTSNESNKRQHVRFWPILLKKSGLVSAAEKYASEIEIFTFGRGFQAQISRSSVQKRRFHWSMTRQFWMTDFFNRIGR
jgi:hypothetical protein